MPVNKTFAAAWHAEIKTRFIIISIGLIIYHTNTEKKYYLQKANNKNYNDTTNKEDTYEEKNRPS